ncbi:MAG: hypothetical protein WBA74_23380 [Cyclobacteriaceae bacterium]
MVELKNNFNKVYYSGKFDAANGYVHTQWFGFVPSEQAIEAVEATIKLLRDSGCKKLLSDNSMIKGAWGETNEWLENNWYREATALGLQKHATILPADIFSKSSHEQFEKSQSNHSIVMKNFQTMEDAKNWLSGG